jgi:2Fe-2S ferredoxin
MFASRMALSCSIIAAEYAVAVPAIYVNKGMDNVQEISDKEEDFIDRAVNPRINSRLGCQCVMIDGDIEVTLPDQSDFMGH